ncbi:MAG: hypothetical protein HRU06_08000 [Oceanospirillaceae bacterium]|nr:hypothetical protein [Oceanospirillaceae bacterium]
MTIMRYLSKLLFLSLLSASCYGQTLTVNVQDINGKAVPDMVVFLMPMDGQKVENSQHEIIISQSQKSFAPYISVTQVANPLRYSNRDDITHHIYSADKDNSFSFIIAPDQEVLKEASAQPAALAMGCNVHDWMSGHLLVLDTPYFSKTNKAGLASLNTNQGGNYQLSLWHPQLLTKANRQTQPITLNSDSGTNMSIDIQLRAKLAVIPVQKSAADFDFLSDY